ncbi:MAG: ABC transporter ATP-binding protein [Gammaproteobacteria bacterium]|jgi:peptide/nickel transport system ATP-binding protein/oligopeptide transport system ATP-binding protein|nr:ABC transporter ATP-binding protein [Gammaproteobacteria bacterium]GIT25608.1 MAG: ABC transporter ATP-binding protein [Gammaproteobacteria bacterium]
MTALLSVKNLTVEFTTRDGIAPVIDDLSFDLAPGETLSLVGESGCGKSMTALAIMGLIPSPPGRVAGGSISLAGENLLQASDTRLRAVRGNDISMVFQEPMTSLNPVFTVGEQISETLRRHQGLNRRQAKALSIEMLDAVQIPLPTRRINDYPHQLSGGMRQRVMIAMALACRPKVLIADEPTTALDVTVQAQIFDLMRAVGKETDAAIILITHDMGSVAEMAERVVVMYAGRKIEEGYVDDILARPRHPYTRGLIACVPHLLETVSAERPSLQEIPGMVPPLSEFGFVGCLFAPRCDRVETRCWQEKPQVTQVTSTQGAACWNLEEAKISADA